MVSLNALAAELKILIIEEVIRNYEEDNEFAFTLVSPTTHALLPLSCVNRAFRAFLAPRLFKKVLLVNSKTSGRSIEALAHGPHAKHVRTIEYVAFTQVILYQSEQVRKTGAYTPHEKHFPPSVQNVLENLGLFQNLELVSVGFSIRNDLHDLTHLFYTMVNESEDMILAQEMEFGWRKLLNDTYSALASNPPGTIRNLHLEDLICRRVSCWQKKPWQNMLRHLEGLSVNFSNAPRPNSDWDVGSSRQAHGLFVSRWIKDVLGHLNFITHLSLNASLYGPFGHTNKNSIETCIFDNCENILDVPSLPNLKVLHLGHVYIGPGLACFLHSHSSTLRSVSLTDSYALGGEGLENMQEFTWEMFFDELRKASPLFPHLNSFYVDEKPLESTYKDEQAPQRRAERKFAVAWIDRTFGDHIVDWHGETEWHKDEDWPRPQDSYKEFMKIVEKNKQTIRSNQI